MKYHGGRYVKDMDLFLEKVLADADLIEDSANAVSLIVNMLS